MPGPGPHMMYALGSSLGLMSTSNGRFSPHHSLAYAINASSAPTSAPSPSGSLPPLALVTPSAPRWPMVLLQRGFLDSVSGVPLTRRQCLLLISAGSLSHFFLDHLFEENGHSSMYTWILSTGWWKNRAPVNPDAVVVVGFLCASLIGGFMYINSQIYWVNPRRAAVGEEADLGVLVFLAIYFFLPHTFCIMSMNPKDHFDMEQLPI
ncbi:hypothetical protein CK203_076576 [Vitis vinifera]|uniref:Uncharacterized protein n=1 Tax=Vitis vinifera TaxID=29760 RepID=A0A438EYR6_VITVI|nr:hypothetical protein CK203_076576 [Vitis vinifera]